MKQILTALLALTLSVVAHASGAIVAGGKTNSAIVIYEDKLDDVTKQIVLNELGKQLALGMISGYGWVKDENGVPAKCAQFGLLKTYAESARFLLAVAEKANSPDAIRSVGGCRFDAAY